MAQLSTTVLSPTATYCIQNCILSAVAVDESEVDAL